MAFRRNQWARVTCPGCETSLAPHPGEHASVHVVPGTTYDGDAWWGFWCCGDGDLHELWPSKSQAGAGFLLHLKQVHGINPFVR